MNKLYIILTLLGIFTIGAKAQTEEVIKMGKWEILPVLPIEEPSIEMMRIDSIASARDKQNYEILDLIAQDSTMQRRIEDDRPDIRVVNSPDGKMRAIAWVIMDEGILVNNYAIQYFVTKDKTRICSSVMSSSIPPHMLEDNWHLTHDILITNIHPIRDGIYLLSSDIESMKMLIAVDIGRGILRDAYVWGSRGEYIDNDKDQLHSVKEDIDGKLSYKVDGLRLIANKAKDNLIFNGTHYEPESLYWSRFEDKLIAEIPYGTHLYYTRPGRNKPVTTAAPTELMALKLDVAFRGDSLVDGQLYPITLRTTEENEHKDAKFVNISAPLISLNNRVFVEGICLYYLPIEEIAGNIPLTKIINTAGRESGYTYEWLRYSALVFDRQKTNAEDYKRIQWLLEVDGKEQLLDPELYRGTQIDLQMREQWTGKTIVVTPYIENCEINRKVSMSTEIKKL